MSREPSISIVTSSVTLIWVPASIVRVAPLAIVTSSVIEILLDQVTSDVWMTSSRAGARSASGAAFRMESTRSEIRAILHDIRSRMATTELSMRFEPSRYWSSTPLGSKWVCCAQSEVGPSRFELESDGPQPPSIGQANLRARCSYVAHRCLGVVSFGQTIPDYSGG